jgi:uncharacterized protein YecA (UPF0149 family)
MSTPDVGRPAALPGESFEATAAANGEPAAAPPEERHLPIRHTGPVLARNAPCPLGTGKKFKYCCGADGKTKVCTGAGAQK